MAAGAQEAVMADTNVGARLVAGAGLAENADAFAALTARANLEASRAAAPRATDHMCDREIIRIFGAMLHKAAMLTGVAYQDYDPYDFEGLAAEIVRVAASKKLPPADYRVVWMIFDLFRRHPSLSRDETAASASHAPSAIVS
jgi:hypothetical protein